MNEHEKVDPKVNQARRKLVVATSVVGGAAGIGAAVPFVSAGLTRKLGLGSLGLLEVVEREADHPDQA